MKPILVIAGYLVLLPALLRAQSVNTTQRPHPDELGALVQTDISGGNRSLTLAGIQYKKWKNEHFGIRALAGYISADIRQDPYYIGAIGHNALEQRTVEHMKLGVLGLGAEAKRRLYKQFYVFGAVELKGGYGTGYTDSIISGRYRFGTREETRILYTQRSDTRVWYMDVMPSVGVAVRFPRINFGIETSAITQHYTHIGTRNGGGYSLFEFNAGNLMHRAFLMLTL